MQDPGHSGADVGQQMAHGMSGFVANYMTTRAYQDGGDVMRYQVADNVPVYDFFSQQFAICERRGQIRRLANRRRSALPGRAGRLCRAVSRRRDTWAQRATSRALESSTGRTLLA